MCIIHGKHVVYLGFDWWSSSKDLIGPNDFFKFIYLLSTNFGPYLSISHSSIYLPPSPSSTYLPSFCTYLSLIFWSSHLPPHLPLALHFFYVHCCGIRVDVCKGMSRSVNGLFVYKAHNRKGLRMKTNSLD